MTMQTHVQGNFLDITSPSDHNMNDAAGENTSSFTDSLVFSDEETSKHSRANISDNHSKDATTTVADSSDDDNNDNMKMNNKKTED